MLAIFEQSGSSTAVPERDEEAKVLSGKQEVWIQKQTNSQLPSNRN